jgi:superfamily II DNA or RNA helicase
VITNYHKFGNKSLNQTFEDRLSSFPRDFFNAIIIDESHHAPSNSHLSIMHHFHAALRFFFSATPYGRADDRHENIHRTTALLITPDYAIKRRMIRRVILCEYGFENYNVSIKVRRLCFVYF